MDLAAGKLRLDFPADHVARLTIDNPAKRNALDHEILDAFAAALGEIEARALQHEIDHLDGVLILDRVASLDTDVFRRRR